VVGLGQVAHLDVEHLAFVGDAARARRHRLAHIDDVQGVGQDRQADRHLQATSMAPVLLRSSADRMGRISMMAPIAI
jgi:hypothetical protein